MSVQLPTAGREPLNACTAAQERLQAEVMGEARRHNRVTSGAPFTVRSVTELHPLTFEQLSTRRPENLASTLLGMLPPRGKVFLRRAEILRVMQGTTPPPAPAMLGGGIRVPQPDDCIRDHPNEAINLAATFQQLERDGLVVNWAGTTDVSQLRPGDAGELFVVTRLGQEARMKGERGAAFMRARRRLGVELHETLEPKLRTIVAVGAFEYAAMIALRAVEARVRQMTGDPRPSGKRLTGVPLMTHAFNEKGALRDLDAEGGEQLGVMQLFTGAFGAVRNVLMHTEAEWSDDIEAAEYVLLADLLMRLLDKAERRLAAQQTPSGALG